MIQRIFTITDMHCSNCAMTIDGLEDELSGVRQVSTSYHKGEMKVEYDENKVTTEEIISAVKKLGYTAVLK